MQTYSWFTLVYTGNSYNIIKQPHPNKKKLMTQNYTQTPRQHQIPLCDISLQICKINYEGNWAMGSWDLFTTFATPCGPTVLHFLKIIFQLIDILFTFKSVRYLKSTSQCCDTLIQVSRVALVVKNLLANARDLRDVGSTSGSGRSPGGGYGSPLQYSCREMPRTEEPGVAESRT